MNKLVAKLAETVIKRMSAVVETLPDPRSELRSVFNGPPEEMLRPLLGALATDGAIVVSSLTGVSTKIPVVLPVQRLAEGDVNPQVNASGICDAEHLLALRNTPACRQFLTLSPPGRVGILSLTQAGESFGVSTAASSGSADIDEWWHDDFVQELVDEAARSAGFIDSKQEESARRLLERAVRAADQADKHSSERVLAWRVLARAFEATTHPRRSDAWSLACGFPPTDDGRLDAPAQEKALDSLLDTLVAEGFGSTKQRMSMQATEEESVAIADCFRHLRASAEIALALQQAGPHHFGVRSAEVPTDAPLWWSKLTASRITELLERDGEEKIDGSLELYCTNTLVVPGRGLPAIVVDAPQFEVTLPDSMSTASRVLFRREAQKAADRREWTLAEGKRWAVQDESAPLHSKPIRYTASTDGAKVGSTKLVSLASWEPGIVLTCKSARKLELPKRAKTNSGADFECTLVLEGEGRHFLDLYLSPAISQIELAGGQDTTSDAGGDLEAFLSAQVIDGSAPWGLEIVATVDCTFILHVRRSDGKAQKIRLIVRCEETSAEACRSQFECLIRLNRDLGKGKARPFVQVDRQIRIADLQGWGLQEAAVRTSMYPVVIASDVSNHLRAPDWGDQVGTVISGGKFLHDPRPRIVDMTPPRDLVDARVRLADRIRGPEGRLLVEEADLGKWSHDPDFLQDVDVYVRSYTSWLSSEPDVACWADTIVVARLEADGKTLSQEPDAVIISPLHPVKLAWHVYAQRALYDAYRAGRPCPAASVLDPDAVPDTIVLPLVSPGGTVTRVPYFSTECGSDYWTVLWNANKLDRLGTHGMIAPFDTEFGLRLGTVSSGFSASQVKRALDDVSSLLAAKPTLSVLVASGAGHSKSCDEGLMDWASERFGPADDAQSRLDAMGRRLLRVVDDRSANVQPEPAAIASLAEETSGAVRWYARVPETFRPDLSIIAQLETTNANVDASALRTPLGHGGIIRHRLRTQLRAGDGAFLAETRMALKGPPTDDVFANHLAEAISLLENLGSTCLGLVFAPSVQLIQSLFEDRHTEYLAVSSAAVDPACFLGGWLPGIYLWDYELPAYSSRAGDSNGYYLLSHVREIDRDALKELLAKLPGLADLAQDQAEAILLEVGRRGIPTVRGLSSGHSGAAGDLGLFLAGRLLQDEFRSAGEAAGLLPIKRGDEGKEEVFLVVPVDPFRGYLHELQRALPKQSPLRPDLLIVGVAVTDSKVKIRLTPVEVKYRSEQMSTTDRVDALEQARALSLLLGALQACAADGGLVIWRAAYQHMLLSMVDFGFRVYSQRAALGNDAASWARLHQRVVAAILGDAAAIELDSRGRLIVFDSSAQSAPADIDNDGFAETMVVSRIDAASVVRGDASELLADIRFRLGDWHLSAEENYQQNARAPRQGTELAHDEESTVGVAGRTGKQAAELSNIEPCRSQNVGSAIVEDSHSTSASALEVSHAPALIDPPVAATADGMQILVGETTDGFRQETRWLRPNQTTLNHLNMGVVGDLGTGKTQLVKSLVHQITSAPEHNDGVRPRFLILDYKKDYAAADFVQAAHAKVVQPFDLPVNLFDTTGSTHKQPWFGRYKFFNDVLSKIYSNIGPVQSERLKEAVRAAYQNAQSEGRQPTIYNVFDEYKKVTRGSIDSVYSIMSDMIDNGLFTETPQEGAAFASFFDGVVVLSLDKLGQDDRTKNMVVAIMLNLFYEHMLTIPKRPFRGVSPQLRTVDSYLLVDEADNIMKHEFDVLRSILQQGREFGVGVILASQYLRHFKAGSNDYREPLLSWFIHKVPNIAAAELVALGMPAASQDLAARIQSLPNHHLLYKTVGVAGDVVKGAPFYELIAREQRLKATGAQ